MRMKTAYYRILALFLYTFVEFMAPVHAQNVRSNPLLMPLGEYELVYTEEKFDKIEFPLSEVELTTITGNKEYVAYELKNKPSTSSGNNYRKQKIMNQFSEVVRRYSGEEIYKNEDAAGYYIKSRGAEIWCLVETYKEGEGYSISIMTKKKLQEAETAEDMLALIEKKGSLDLYIGFASGSAELTDDSYLNIREVARFLKKAPSLKISIEGHTDNVGTPENNKRLSQARAAAVKEALVNVGVPADRMTTKGWGQERPIASNTTKDGRLKNRRVSIVKRN
ncbi:OmpA family protein [Algivirga pacifica]|uniref:OmpA-like domain-containing protein n=1 Tax=Algivirga pacifica TaxID=1162670 RepID=A0ABP9DCR9_9BACT